MMIIANVYSAVTYAKHLSLGYLSLITALRGRFHFPYKETEAKKGCSNGLKSQWQVAELELEAKFTDPNAHSLLPLAQFSSSALCDFCF